MIHTKKEALAPDFTAIDSAGNEVRLSGFKGNKNVLLVFNRGFQ